ncbi:MAG: S8 family serine peptidase, partial [Chloroflexia bacterium]
MFPIRGRSRGSATGRLLDRPWFVLFCFCVICLPLVGGSSTTASAGGTAGPVAALLGQPSVTTASDGAAAKIAPDLMEEAKQSQADPTAAKLGVLVVSEGPLADLSGLQSAIPQRPDANGLTFTSGKVSPGGVVKLASASNVIAVLSNKPPEVPPLPDPALARPKLVRPYPGVGGRGSGIGNPGSGAGSQQTPPTAAGALTPGSPDSWHAIDVHHARDAWAQGYKGNGVKVAVLDSGVDFGHPDLQGTFARVDNPASPYYGWPYVVDPYSMELMSLGVTLDVPTAITGYGSWYINTQTTVRGNTAQFTTVTASANAMEPVTHTYTLPGTSRSGVYHIGIHPDEHLAFDVFGEYPVVLVADTVTEGVYDTVYVDLNDNHDFRDDTPQRKGSELTTRDLNGDGIADLSSGLLYFIADGRLPVPASDWMFGLLTPGNGDLVALYGSMDYGEDHGTFCASSVVAQGRIDGPSPLRPPYKPTGVGGMVQGMAPEAKIVAIGNVYRSGQAIYNALVLATLGLDGRPNTGDEPQVASMSFGFSGGWNNGWDFMSRYLMYLAQYNPNLAMLASTGNGGPGYGTITPPSTSPAAISVGAATQYGEQVLFEPISSTDRITWGDVQPWSNRGPSHLGQPKPDFVAVGAWGTGDVPINMSHTHDGSTSYDVWGGTSMSTPLGAGITALVYQAYKARNGVWPTAETARGLLKSSATDLKYGPFTQGAGMLDASRAVKLAAGREGIVVSPSSWVPGSTAPGFIGTVRPGESVTGTFAVQNPTNQAATATLSAQQLVKTSEYEWSVPAANSQESEHDFGRPDYLMNMTSHVPADTDFLKVTAVVSYSQFSASDPRSPFLGPASTWRLLAYDWRDDNRDGLAYRDTNGNGVVNDGEEERGELNRLTYGYNTNDQVEIDVSKPLERTGAGVMIGLQHQLSTNAVPNSIVRLKITTYKRQPWTFLTPPSGPVTIPAGQAVSVTVSAQAPAGTSTGAYEGLIAVDSSMGGGDGHIVVPVAINVKADSLHTTFGGANGPPANTPYDSGRVLGQQNWSWRPDSGDWRHFYIDNSSQPQDNTFLWASAQWKNFPTDLDLIIGGPAPWDWFSQRYPSLFGPFAIDGLAGSVWTNLGGGDWQWQTATNTNEEWVAARLGQTGTHEAVLHNVFYSGLEHSEPFTATLGTVRLSQDSVSITSNQTSDSATMTMTTNMDLPGVRAQAFGLSQKRTWPNNEIMPLHTWFTETNVSDVAAVEFSTEAPDGTNVDLYVDHWENGRYVWLASSTSPTGNEFVHIEPAQPGNYRVRVDAARDVPNPAHFNYSLKAIQGTDMTVSPAAITSTIPAGTTLTFTVGYNRPSITNGVWEGRLFLGPYKAPTLHSLPVTVYYGNVPPTLTPTPAVCHIRFTDVPPGHWAYDYIQALYCRNIVSGYIDNTFRPGDQASRAQVVKMVVLAMGWPLVHPATPSFVDVLELSWGY